MIIVSQDKELILNFENIEAIGIGNPLEDDDGMFKVLASTTSDNEYILGRYANEYTLGRYATEERAKKVLQEIVKQYKNLITSYQKGRSDYPIETLMFNRNVYEMPVEKVDDK